jgi:uncharacterized protein
MQVMEVRNAELIESLTRQAAEHGITDAAIVALIGAPDSFIVSTPLPATPPRTLSPATLPAEMTATSEIIDGKPHIHAVMAIQGDRAVAGHLIQVHFGTSFAHAYVIPSEQHVALRANEGLCSNTLRAAALRVGAESSTSEPRPRARAPRHLRRDHPAGHVPDVVPDHRRAVDPLR